MKVSTAKRLQMIQEELLKQGEVSSRKLSQTFQVSMETIRKDLEILEENGTARKVYGGAVLDQTGAEKTLDIRLKGRDQKVQTAKQAVRLLEGSHSVFLDSGSTVLAAVPLINRMPSMNILTNSLDAFEALDGDLHHVFLCGGKKREKNRALTGSAAEEMIRHFHIDTALMGTAGILDLSGPSCHSYQELTLKKAVRASSDRLYILADPSKFRESGLHVWTDWSKVDGVVCPGALSAAALRNLPPDLFLVQDEPDEKR